MQSFSIVFFLAVVIYIYFITNPLRHSPRFILRRFINWFPLGMSYAFLYMARYNLNVSKNAFGSLMSKESFGIIFAVGTFVYGSSFLINGPLVDKIGGKRGIIISCIGACFANVLMGVATYLLLHGQLHANVTVVFSILYGLNMFFQSYGGVSIIKVKAYWFHVRERGIFGAIFGSLISIGVFFAFDWGQAIVDAAKLHIENPSWFQRSMQSVFAIGAGTTDAYWLVFFIPAGILIFWAILDAWLIKDTPGDANFEDFDTHDASSGEDENEKYTVGDLLKRIFTNPILLMIAFIAFTAGVLKNGIMQWYFVFAKEVPQVGAEFFFSHWGFLLCVFGILGGFASGYLSDNVFQSRRGPPTAIFFMMMTFFAGLMALILFKSPFVLGVCCSFITMAVIGTQSLTSGTAAVDFGGRKAAATASGIVDGFVYLGGGVQSFVLGYLTSKSWAYWPMFLIPFAVIGLFLSLRIWKDIPAATKRYLMTVEKVNVDMVASVDSEGHLVGVSKEAVVISKQVTT